MFFRMSRPFILSIPANPRRILGIFCIPSSGGLILMQLFLAGPIQRRCPCPGDGLTSLSVLKRLSGLLKPIRECVRHEVAADLRLAVQVAGQCTGIQAMRSPQTMRRRHTTTVSEELWDRRCLVEGPVAWTIIHPNIDDLGLPINYNLPITREADGLFRPLIAHCWSVSPSAHSEAHTKRVLQTAKLTARVSPQFQGVPSCLLMTKDL